MLSNTKAKYIKSLQIKKYRKKHRSFLVEGAKNVRELFLSDFEIDCLVSTDEFYGNIPRQYINAGLEVYIEKQERIESLGTLSTNDAAIAVVRMPVPKKLTLTDEVVLVLDDVRDPGNMGTIIRTADWYGIKKIIASEDSADQYNSKVIQASMGSFARVDVYYQDLAGFFDQHPSIDVLGAFLDGKSIHNIKFQLPVAIVLGNESKGISGHLKKYISQQITIPRFGNAESLNVAMSTAIICDNLMRIKSIQCLVKT